MNDYERKLQNATAVQKALFNFACAMAWAIVLGVVSRSMLVFGFALVGAGVCGLITYGRERP